MNHEYRIMSAAILKNSSFIVRYSLFIIHNSYFILNIPPDLIVRHFS